MVLNKSLQYIPSYLDFYLSLFEWAEILCKQGLHRASGFLWYFWCYTSHAVTLSCLHILCSHPCKAGSLATLYPIDHYPIDHSPSATAEMCYHSQLSSDSQHSFYQTSQVSSTGTETLAGSSLPLLLNIACGSSLKALLTSAALLLPPIPSPPAFWPSQTNAGYLHSAVCISTTQVFTSPCWFPQCAHLEHPNQENTSLPTQQRVIRFPCTSQQALQGLLPLHLPGLIQD